MNVITHDAVCSVEVHEVLVEGIVVGTSSGDYHRTAFLIQHLIDLHASTKHTHGKLQGETNKNKFPEYT